MKGQKSGIGVGLSTGTRTDAAPGATAGSTFLMEVFDRLQGRYELDRWHWQADTPAFDICVGAILVQHTAWAQVEKAIANLRQAGSFSAECNRVDRR